MTLYHPFGSTTYTLGQSISSTDTSIILSSFVEPVTGVPYTMVLINSDIAFGTISPKTSSSEFISFTGITQNANGTATLTGVTRGLAKKYPFASDAAYKLPHSGQSQFIISDMPQVFEKFISLVNDETVDGIKTFTLSPVVPTGGTGTQAANNQDIANAITGISGTATNLTFGTVKLSVAAVSAPNPIVVGDNDPRVPTIDTSSLTAAQLLALPGNNTEVAVGSGNKYVTQTGLEHNAEKYAVDTSGSSVAYVAALSPIPTSQTAGMVVYIKIVNSNTTTTPTLALNGLTARTIVKGVNTPLVVGDIGANQLCQFMFDATNNYWVLQNPTNNTSTGGFISYSTNTTTAIPSNATYATVFCVATRGGESTAFSVTVDSHNTPVSSYAVGGGTALTIGFTATWNPGGNLVITTAASATAIGSVGICFYK